MSGFDEDKEEVLCLLQFSGKEENWKMWSRKFIARVSIKHYVDVLFGVKEAAQMIAVDAVESAEKLKIR